MDLQFTLPSRTQITNIGFDSYYQGCPGCKSKIYAVQHTSHKSVQEIGTPFIRNIHNVESKTVRCGKCGWQGSPEHPYYPKNYTVTLGVITYALKAALGTDNCSAKTIASQLHSQHHVDIDDKTVQKWIDHHQDTFLNEIGCDWDTPAVISPLISSFPSLEVTPDPPPYASKKSLRERMRSTLQAKLFLQQIQRRPSRSES